MLTPSQDVINYDELIMKSGGHCTHLKAGNPFLSDQDFLYYPEDDGEFHEECSLDDTSLQPDAYVERFFEESLTSSLQRLNRHPQNPHIVNSLGVDYLRMGQFDKALKTFRKSIEIAPGFFPAKANIAKCYVSLGKVAKALAVYKELEEESPNNVTILVNIALLYFKEKDFESSLRYLNKAKGIDPKNYSVWNNLGIINLIKDDVNRAISCARKAYRLKSDDLSVLNNLGVCFAVQGNIEKAANYFKIAHTIDRTDINTIKNLSRAYQIVQKHKQAINITDEFISDYGGDAELRDILSFSLFKTEQYEKCLKQLRIALKETKADDAKSISALINNIGVVYGYIQILDKSEEFLIKSLEINPEGDMNIHCNIIHFYFSINNFHKAKERIDNALCFYPNEAIIHGFLGEYFLHVGEYETAKKSLLKAVDLNPELLFPYASLTTIIIDIDEKPEEAQEMLEKCFSNYPSSIQIINNYAYSLILLGKLEKARIVLDKATDDNNVQLNATRGLLLIKEGDLKEGRRYYNRAIKLAKNKPNLARLAEQKKFLELSKHYLSIGDSSNAERLLKKGAKIKTRDSYYKKQIIRLLGQVAH